MALTHIDPAGNPSMVDVSEKTITKRTAKARSIVVLGNEIMQLLQNDEISTKEGGRMAIVLPNGNFENPSLDYLRYYIKLKAKILAIVNLPQETFIPFGTGVKTSLLFLQKAAGVSDTPNKVRLGDTSQYPIFFGRITKLGY